MRYQNTKTGVIIDFNCEVSGEHWVKLDAPQIEQKVDETPKETKRKKK